MHEYLKLVVIENKLVPYEYFMDEMHAYELYDLIDLIPWSNKHSYEQMRYMVWASLKPYLKKKDMTPEKLLPYYTDTHSTQRYEHDLSSKQIDAIRNEIKEKYMTNNRNG